MEIIRLRGSDIGSILHELGELRITVFRDFPYLYDGNMDYELDYLTTYSQSPNAYLVGLYDQQQLVGATTCIPLHEESPEIREPFHQAGISTEGILYFGESILLSSYRGKGIGHLFFDERESYGKSLNTIHTTCFCSVERLENHPLQPSDYRSNNVFWTKRGYTPNGLSCHLEWKDIDQQESTNKTLHFWTKEWSQIAH